MVREKRHNLLLMAIAVALVGGLAFGSGLQTRDAEVKKALLTASLTLLFGGLLGGCCSTISIAGVNSEPKRCSSSSVLSGT